MRFDFEWIIRFILIHVIIYSFTHPICYFCQHGTESVFGLGYCYDASRGQLHSLSSIWFLLPMIWRRMDLFGKVFLCSVIMSTSIELIQLFFNWLTRYPNRVADVDDLILNVLGACMGYGVWRTLRWMISKWIERRENVDTNYHSSYE